SSTESPGATGMNVITAEVTRFEGEVRVPQLGWNQVAAGDGARYLRDGVAYFANSYRIVSASTGWVTATADYAGTFVAAAERGSVLACQFHPELSGAWGAELLKRWLEES
ncbi:MAG: imidazole glycerol phosphate synthase HisHF, partial [Clostridia bacterium]|nr:imidazole glycerol phosphate synthase HisHF [Deltaproteobacteria bacterium]